MPAPAPSLDAAGRCMVLLHNDDVTEMNPVVPALGRLFGKTREEAVQLTLPVHREGVDGGVAVCGSYAYDVAERKVAEVMDFCRQLKQPLQCSMEKE